MDSAIAQMDQISMRSALEKPPISSPASPRPPCPFIPPEILSHVFYQLSLSSYDEEKVTFARLCLVNRCFLPIAREFLYSTLNLYLCTNFQTVVNQRPEDTDKVESGVKLFVTLVKVKHLALLVQEIYVSFANLPPLSEDSVQVGGLIRELENLKKIWFKDEGENWWTGKQFKGKGDNLKFLRVLISQSQNLEVLVIPQVLFDASETFHLFNSLKNLKVFKGGLSAPSNRSLELGLTHLYVARHTHRRDLEYYINPSSRTLRYLHLDFDGNTPLLSLDKLQNLEELVITVNVRSSHCLVALAHSASFGPFLQTGKYLPHLSSLTLNFATVVPMFSRLLCKELFAGGLPIKLEEFAVGPEPPIMFTWRTFLDHAPPTLKTLHLVDLDKLWDKQEMGRDEFLFGVEDLEKDKGIKVEWMKPEAWGKRIEKMFCSRYE